MAESDVNQNRHNLHVHLVFSTIHVFTCLYKLRKPNSNISYDIEIRASIKEKKTLNESMYFCIGFSDSRYIKFGESADVPHYVPKIIYGS